MENFEELYEKATEDHGKNKEKSAEEAFNIFEEYAKQGNAEAQFYLGQCYEKHVHVSMDLDKAAELYRKAMEQGNLDANVQLGGMHLRYTGWSKDREKGFELLQKAVDKGSVSAKKVMLLNGRAPK